MPTADPAAQRRLLDIAAIDQQAAAAQHRRSSLPELAVLATAAARTDELNGRLVMAGAEVSDLDRAARKLDDEVEQVRARSARDAARLASGAGAARELEGLEHEIASLARRQSALEDQELELMEQREAAEAVVASLRTDLSAVAADADAARTRRDDQFVDIDDELARLTSKRSELVSGIPEDVRALYDRIRASGKVAEGALRGAQCGDRKSVV